MGTSSIYNGPKDRNPLLPEDFNEESENVVKSSPWQDTKTAISQYITGNSTSKARVVRNHVKAMGGANRSSRQAISGKKSTIHLGRFLSNIASIGILKTLEKLQVDYIGKSAESLLSEIVNIISVDSSTKEDAIARNTTLEVLSELYEFIQENEMDITCLDRMNDSMMDQIMTSYISIYIFEKMLNDLQSRFEEYASSIDDALQKEREFKEYIKTSVEIKLNDIKFSKIDYSRLDVVDIIEGIYTECYEVLEGCL